MPGYSADRNTTLANVRPRNIYVLLTILHEASIRDRSFIAARYSDTAMHFEETLAFVQDLGWIRTGLGVIEPASEVSERIVAAKGTDRNLLFAEEILASSGPYRQPFARYLSQYERVDNQLIHRPSVEARLNETGVRDFFMDLGAVRHKATGDFFVLEPAFAPCALWARNVLSPTPSHLARHAADRSTLGYRAELAVLESEKNRIGRAYQHRVRHIAQDSPAACFDIQSVTISLGDVVPRFIEVKAVALGSFEFHWTRTEIEAAEILGERYFLYLLPVIGPNAFDLSQMEIIQNAYAEVYRKPSMWTPTVAEIVCRKNASIPS